MATLTEIRKKLDAQDVQRTKDILKIFLGACESDPEAIKQNFSKFIKDRSTEEQLGHMLDLYRGSAEYLLTIFDYS